MPGFLQNERRGPIAAWVPFVLLVCVLAPCICVGFPGQDRASEGHHGQGAAHWERRADSVRDAIQHAWRGYRRYASSSDDLKPLAKVGHQWMYARATFYDSLDLLYLAGLHKDFEEAVAEITSPLSPWTYWHRGTPTSVVFPVKTFEYHIRVVGGLLGAYALSGRRELLRAAAHAADCVLDSFATPNGIPRPFFRVAHPTRSPLLALVAKLLDSCRVASDRAVWRNYLASFGSFGLELRVLSRETGDPRYVGAADALQAIVHRRWVRLGRPELLPRTWGVPPPAWAVRFFGAPDDVSDTDRYPPRWVGFGSAGDSFYEYLVKEQLVDGGGGTAMHREMYDVVARQCHSVNSSACRHDVGRNGNATLITAVAAGELLRGRDRQPHLACFAGGMFALGAKMLPGHAADMALATGITSQCVASYTMTPTGLGADYTKVGPDGELSWPEGRYHLRPEVVESLFVMYRTTRDDKYAWALASFATCSRCCHPCATADWYHTRTGSRKLRPLSPAATSPSSCLCCFPRPASGIARPPGQSFRPSSATAASPMATSASATFTTARTWMITCRRFSSQRR